MQWNVDTNHAEIEFAVRHLMISTVKGRFRTFDGSGETDIAGKLESVALTIDAASIDTNVSARDAHLRSADFFDVATHPTITFRSTAIEHDGSAITIRGDLAMKGATKPVVLRGTYAAPSNDPWGNPRAALSVTGTINRKEWGLNWNQVLEAGGVTVGDDVTLRIEVEAVAKADPVPNAA